MKINSYLNTCIFLCLYLSYHPFHVSVSEIYYNNETKSIEITHKFFIDDFEKSLKNYIDDSELQFKNRDDHTKNSKHIISYLFNHFEISINHKKVDINYIGSENNWEYIWIYQEIKKIRKIKEIIVDQRCLLDIHETQTNIVNFKYKQNKIVSINLNREKQRFNLKY